MNAARSDTMRELVVTPGNLRQNHLYVKGHYDFFPLDCIGGPKASANGNRLIDIFVEGLNEVVQTDIGRDARSGRPRAFLRGRGWVRRFYKHHRLSAGAKVTLERLGERNYRLSVHSSTDAMHPTRVAAEFFAGIGLVRLALEENGVRVAFANDIDPDKFEMYRMNFGDRDFLLGDVHKVTAEEVPDCDLVTASFPCNDLSIAGTMAGLNAGQSSAFWGLVDILRGMGRRRPRMVLLENVPGFLMSHKGKDFQSALMTLNELGYACDAMFLDAAWFVPQSRLRLFVVAQQGEGGAVPFGLEPSPTRPACLTDFMLSHPGVRWRIVDVPKPPKLRRGLASVIENLADDDEAWWNTERTKYFMGQLSERHARAAREMIAAPVVTYATAFRRVRNGRSMAELRSDGLAGCLRTPRGGSGRQILFKAGMGRHQVRLLTPRECARLQGVPEWYRIDVPLNQALFGFGDAVCVPVVSWLAKHYLLTELQGITTHEQAVFQS